MRKILTLAALLAGACSDGDGPTLPAEFELVGVAGSLAASPACAQPWVEFQFGADGSGFQGFTVRMDRNADFPGQSAYLPWLGEYAACSDAEGGSLRCEWNGLGGSWTIEPSEIGAHVTTSDGPDCTASLDATIIDPGR